METPWTKGPLTIRQIQEHGFAKRKRPAYTTVQTTVYRLEAKSAVRRASKISNAHVFEPVLSRDAAGGRLLDELLSFFGGGLQPVIAHLIESGKFTAEDVKQAEKTLRDFAKREKPNEFRMALRSSKSPVAIHARHAVGRDAGFAGQNVRSACPLLDMVRCIREIPRAVLSPDRPGKWGEMAVGSAYRGICFRGYSGHHVTALNASAWLQRSRQRSRA
jgi:predicted transcriptional regulator